MAIIRSAALLSLCVLTAAPLTARAQREGPLQARGVVVPERRVSVTSSTPGQVTEVLVRVGQAVRKGELLFRLECARQEAQVRKAEAKLTIAKARMTVLHAGAAKEIREQTRAEVAAAEARLKAAEADFNRVRQLFAAGAVRMEDAVRAEAVFTEARTELEKRRAALAALEQGPAREQLDVLRAEVHAAEAGVQLARVALEATTIRAPIDGTVLQVRAEVGAFTNPAMFGLANAAGLCELADLTSLAVEADLPEREFTLVKVGMPCDVTVHALDKVYRGTLERIVPVIDPGRNTFAVRVKLGPIGTDTIPAGASATVRFLKKE